MVSPKVMLTLLSSVLLLSSSFAAAYLPSNREIWTALRDGLQSGQRSLQQKGHVPTNAANFSANLFKAHMDLANKTFQTCFVQGIANGNLDPVDFGTFTMQHANYLFQMQNHLTTLSMQAIDCSEYDVAAFAFAQGLKYGVYVSEIFETWDIRYGFCIKSEGAMIEYLKFQEDVLKYYPTYYMIMSALPRHMLWDWLGEKLKPYNTSDNIYSFWICEECDSSHPWQFFIDDHEKEFEPDIADKLFEIAMTHEYNFFSTNCGGEPLPVPVIPPPPQGCASQPMPPPPSPPTPPSEPTTNSTLVPPGPPA